MTLSEQTLTPADPWNLYPEILAGKSLGEVLLTPTQIYVKPVLNARGAGIDIHGMAHITGGGFARKFTSLPWCQSIYSD